MVTSNRNCNKNFEKIDDAIHSDRNPSQILVISRPPCGTTAHGTSLTPQIWTRSLTQQPGKERVRHGQDAAQFSSQEASPPTPVSSPDPGTRTAWRSPIGRGRRLFHLAPDGDARSEPGRGRRPETAF